MTLAEEIALEARWLPTSKNIADQPSRGSRVPGPCLPVPLVRPRGRGQGGYAARRVGEADHPEPFGASPRARRSQSAPTSVRMAFWSPLLDEHVNAESRRRYAHAVYGFIAFVRSHGDRIDDAADLDYWLAYYAHTAYVPPIPQ